MHIPSNPLRRILPAAVLALSTLSNNVAAERIISSTSLNPCMDHSLFSATLFNITYTPDRGKVEVKVNGVSELTGNVTAMVEIVAYGYTAVTQKVDPCKLDGFQGMCPMMEGVIELYSTVDVPEKIADQIPAIAYQVPNLDGLARITVNRSDTNEMVVCVEAPLDNGKTVDQHAVGWITAVIAGLGLVASAVTSGLGHSNTAAHVAANAVSLFGYFQAQAMLSMTAVHLPPIVAAWTQNFDWAMGIINLDFMQQIFHWYIQATGGTPANLRDRLTEISVRIQKRSLDATMQIPSAMGRAAMYGFEPTPWNTASVPEIYTPNPLTRRSNNDNSAATITNEVVVVTGIERLAFKAKIEITNFFMTGLSFFIVMVCATALAVTAFKGASEFAIKMKWIRGSKFVEFRNGWKTVLKGIIYRLVLIGWSQMVILCLWELTSRDSSGAVVLAVFFILSIFGILAWASFKVIMIAKRSTDLHKNPAYILYSDPSALNRWGFLYVQFRASAYYFIVPLLTYFLIKALFIAFGQKSGLAQAIGLLLTELVYLITVCVMRPWMDKRTNIFNISICVINFINTVFLLVFTDVFRGPDIVAGVMGVIFFIMNAIFALVLLVLVLVSSTYALVSRNPDIRYQPMRDDRTSFIKSNSQSLTSTELDALGATARGETKSAFGSTRDLDDDGFVDRAYGDASQVPLPPSTAGSGRPVSQQSGMPRSPVDPAVPLFPSTGGPGAGAGLTRSLTPDARSPSPYQAYNGGGGGGGGYMPYNAGNGGGNGGQGGQPMQWNVGAGYER